jgi:hypothetical protein
MTMSSAPIQTTALALPACPSCGATLEAITGTGVPQPGRLALCVYCRVFLILTDDRQLRLLSTAEWGALSADSRALLTRVRDELPAIPHKDTPA